MTRGGYRHAKQEICAEAIGGRTGAPGEGDYGATSTGLEDLACSGAPQMRSRLRRSCLVGFAHRGSFGMHGQQSGELAETSCLAGAAVAAGKKAIPAVEGAETRWRKGGPADSLSLLAST